MHHWIILFHFISTAMVDRDPKEPLVTHRRWLIWCLWLAIPMWHMHFRLNLSPPSRTTLLWIDAKRNRIDIFIVVFLWRFVDQSFDHLGNPWQSCQKLEICNGLGCEHASHQCFLSVELFLHDADCNVFFRQTFATNFTMYIKKCMHFPPHWSTPWNHIAFTS